MNIIYEYGTLGSLVRPGHRSLARRNRWTGNIQILEKRAAEVLSPARWTSIEKDWYWTWEAQKKEKR